MYRMGVRKTTTSDFFKKNENLNGDTFYTHKIGFITIKISRFVFPN